MEKGVRAEHDENEPEQDARDDGEDFHGTERAPITAKFHREVFGGARCILGTIRLGIILYAHQ